MPNPHNERAKPPAPTRPATSAGTWHLHIALAALWLAVLLAYANSLGGPFVFDDIASIVENPTIRSLRSISTVLSPPSANAETVGGRPLLNLTFALNYAIGGLEVRGYHAVNLLIHGLAAGLMFGLVRRTLILSPPAANIPLAPTGWALAIAALWALHPLQTEAVTQIVQRAESLAGLLFLLTLYGFLRGATSAGPEQKRWLAASVGACLLGMATKETVATAPLIVLLYDRTFLAGSFVAAWRRHPRYYSALAATWLLLLGLVLSTGGRGGSAGFQADGATPWTYLLTQCVAILRYLRLAFWPSGQIFDYGTGTVAGLDEAAGPAGVVLLLLGATMLALRWHPRIGFLGAWFFVILAPSSSIVPVATQTIAERRLYLPLAAVATAVVLGTAAWAGRRALPALLLAAGLLGAATFARNTVYQSALSLWTDTLSKRPQNARAWSNLGLALSESGRPGEAVSHFQTALRLVPDFVDARINLANALDAAGQTDDAVAQLREALRLAPEHLAGHYNLARLLARAGLWDEARTHYEAALRSQPQFAPALNELGHVWVRQGRLHEAEQCFRAAVASAPLMAASHNNLGNVLLDQNRLAEAVGCFQTAVKLAPDHASAHFNLGNTLLQLRRPAEAVDHFAIAARLNPEDAEACSRLGIALAQTGRFSEARSRFEAALHIDANNATARSGLLALGNR